MQGVWNVMTLNAPEIILCGSFWKKQHFFLQIIQSGITKIIMMTQKLTKGILSDWTGITNQQTEMINLTKKSKDV